MGCPRCGRKLEGRRERYGDVYVCKPCAIIILDLKPIMDKWEERTSKSSGG